MLKKPPLAGLSQESEEYSPISTLAGWRHSGDRTRLPVNSLLTGNFTGNLVILDDQEGADWRKDPVLQRLFENSLRRLTGNII